MWKDKVSCFLVTKARGTTVNAWGTVDDCFTIIEKVGRIQGPVVGRTNSLEGS